MIYSRTEITDLLAMIEDGNKNTGGLSRPVPLFYGRSRAMNCKPR